MVMVVVVRAPVLFAIVTMSPNDTRRPTAGAAMVRDVVMRMQRGGTVGVKVRTSQTKEKKIAAHRFKLENSI